MKDEIVEQVRKVREEHAAKFNYDLATIFDDLKQQEGRDGRKTIPPPRNQHHYLKKRDNL